MVGSVEQWCSDIYAPYPAGDVSDPCNHLGDMHVYRGTDASLTRRSRAYWNQQSPAIGFRVAMDAK